MNNTFNNKLVEKQIKEKLIERIRLAQILPKQYIDSGVVDKKFVEMYQQGAGADEDNFGKSFAFYAVDYTVTQLKQNTNNFEKQLKILINFSFATKGLAEHLFKRTHEILNSKLKDEITGIENYEVLACELINVVNNDNRYFEGRKEIIQKCFQPPLKSKIYRIK